MTGNCQRRHRPSRLRHLPKKGREGTFGAPAVADAVEKISASHEKEKCFFPSRRLATFAYLRSHQHMHFSPCFSLNFVPRWTASNALIVCDLLDRLKVAQLIGHVEGLKDQGEGRVPAADSLDGGLQPEEATEKKAVFQYAVLFFLDVTIFLGCPQRSRLQSRPAEAPRG